MQRRCRGPSIVFTVETTTSRSIGLNCTMAAFRGARRQFQRSCTRALTAAGPLGCGQTTTLRAMLV